MKAKTLLLLITLLITLINPTSSQTKFDFSKKGNIHDEVIYSWDNYYRDYFAGEIKKRLFEQGDVYILYDAQIAGLQSFVEMTRRCKDTKQMAELVDLLSPVFSQLKPIAPDNSAGWICTGGSICTAYGLLGKEVPLCSVQFLGLLGALATNITENIPLRKQTPAEKTFVANTFNTISVQLDRWFTPNYFKSVDNRLPRTAADMKDASAGHYFSDRDLWFLTVLSDLSELHLAGVKPAAEDGQKAWADLQTQKEGIAKIFDLFVARSYITTSPAGNRAEIDKGFWKNHFDNRYAKYAGPEAPVTWEQDAAGEWKMITRVKWDSTYLSDDVSWDISHARRLVPAFETFVRNHENIKKVWGYTNPAFDPVALRQAYANQIIQKIWNKSTTSPLFTNFWSGDNGWYRVAYAHQTGRRMEGYTPYGMNDSMPLGGYPIWGAFDPTLRTVFQNLFSLSHSNDPEAKSFISQYYKSVFANRSKSSAKPVGSLAFLSDLVEVSGGKGK
ncbi:hypothetical protein [Daejeonella lutea]|uniref:Uncharacterized protein n=1 Tax=Daejeonella lutea TaxID=572036 RepID=A0A1T5AJ66_9SPHI|nr:hypothetical protein [Daejeonella lutea]SKB35062.1 hypothetical protein SAMN05661099_0790 [Daejeonella lutea]